MSNWLGRYSKAEDVKTKALSSSKQLPYSKKLKKEVKRISTGYTPRPGQKVIHDNLKRFNVLVCHRRFGKTVLVINEMINKGLMNELHNPQYAYVAPTYKQAKMIAWEYLIDYTSKIPGVKVNKSELSIEIYRQGKYDDNGVELKRPDKIKFMLLGSDNPDALRGIYLDGAILDEYAQCDPIIWGEIIRPALADRKGWAIFIGTPKGQNHFYKRLKKAESQETWYAAIIKASESGVLPIEEVEDMKSDMDQEEIDQELECSFHAAVRGSYYGSLINEMEKPTDGSSPRICTVPYDPKYPVDTVWDLGIADSTSIIFRQKIGAYWHIIDYIEENGKGLEHYIREINRKPYIYGRHIWPHDGKNKDFVTGLTRKESAENLGLRVEIQTKQTIQDGIDAARTRLEITRIDAQKCFRLIECLRNYQKEWDPKIMCFKKTPKHDWASHGADAFRYNSLDDKDSKAIQKNRTAAPKYAVSEYDELG